MADEPHPQVEALLGTLEASNAPSSVSVTPTVARKQYEAYAALGGSTPVGETQDFAIEGPAGPLPVRAYIPEGEGPFPTLVYYHGGGMVLGSPDTHEPICTALCARADVVVLSVDYRRAPEHPFPAPVEDAYAALEWADEFAGDLAGDPDRLAVGGDSAGGRLTAAVTLLARDLDGPEIGHQLLIYPGLHSWPLHDFESYEENGEGYVLERDTIEWFYEQFIQNPVHARNAYYSPLLASDLAGLPSATLVTAGFDPLRDEGSLYAERLGEAGVEVHHEHYEGMIHTFVAMPEMLDAGDDALDLLAAELTGSLGP